MSLDSAVTPGDASSERVVVDFDLHSSKFAREYDATLREILAAGPVCWSEAHGGHWIVSRYDDVVEVLRDPVRFSSDHDEKGVRRGYRGTAIPPAPVETGFIEMDPPQHLSRRRLFTGMLSPAAIKARSAEIEALTTAFFDEVVETGSCDYVSQIASPVTAVLTMRLLGVPDSEWELYAAAAHHFASTAPGTVEHDQGLAEYAEVLQSLQSHLGRRLSSDDQQHDVIQMMKDARFDGESMDPEEMMLHLIIFYMGGVDTTTNLLANTVHWLGLHPEVRDELISDPGLMEAAFSEFLRVQTPVAGFARTVTADTVVAGQAMKEGERVYLMVGAANADDHRYECPADLDIRRTNNRPLSFGVGVHRCIGATMAEAIFKSVLSQTLRRMPDFRLAETGNDFYPSFGLVRGMVALNLNFTPTPRHTATA